MNQHTRLRPRGKRGLAAALLGGLLTLGLAVPAHALEQPIEPTPEAAVASTRADAPSFTPDLQAEIFISEESRPSDFVVSPDGTLGYVTSADLNEFVIIDMASHEIVNRVPFTGTGGEKIRVSADGTRAYFGIYQGAFTRTIGIMDLTTQSMVQVLPNPGDIISQLALSQDGNSLYTLEVGGRIGHVDAHTGALIAERNNNDVGHHGLLLIENDSKLLVGKQNTMYTLDAVTLQDAEPAFEMPGVTSVANLSIDESEDRIYLATGGSLGLLNRATQTVQLVSIGTTLVSTAGFDSTNRAYTAAQSWNMIMSANFNTGKRSESFRPTTTNPLSVNTNPHTGDLLVAAGGYSNGVKGSTVSIVHAPRVTAPADAAVSALGETARLESEVIGIRGGHGGGIVWQSSPDGTTWTDMSGENFEQLDVVVTPEALDLQYRLRWADDFWGQHGTSAPAKIVLGAGPEITYAGPLPEGTAGEAYPETVITATGQPDLEWSLDHARATAGLPAGMTLDPATGTLRGTPEQAGTYAFTVRVTDVFGADSKRFELTVRAADGGSTTPVTPPSTGTPGETPPSAGSGDGSGANDTGLSATGSASPAYLWLLAAAFVAAGALLLRSVPRR